MPQRLILALLLLCLSYATPVHSQATPPKPDFRKTGAALPPIKIQQDNRKVFTNAGIKAGRPVVVMIFSPECEHCLQLLDSMKSLAPALSRYQTVLVTEKVHEAAFRKWHNGYGAVYNQMFPHSGWDAGNLIYYIYTYQMLPQINIYNSRQRLVHSFAGMFPMDSLRLYIK